MHADSGRQSALTPPRAAPPRPCRLCLAVAGVTAARRAFHADPHTPGRTRTTKLQSTTARSQRAAPQKQNGRLQMVHHAAGISNLTLYPRSNGRSQLGHEFAGPVRGGPGSSGRRYLGLNEPGLRVEAAWRKRDSRARQLSRAAARERERERGREGEREERSFSLSSGGASIPHATHQRRKLTVGSDDDGRGFRRLEVAMFAKVEALHRA